MTVAGAENRRTGPQTCCTYVGGLALAADRAEALAMQFKAIGHPVRLQILSTLCRFAGQVCVCDIEQQFDLAQPTISHHLKILRQAGLIDCERRGQWYYYFVVPEAMDKLQVAVADLQPLVQATAPTSHGQTRSK